MSTETRLRQAFHAECRYGEGSPQMATLGVDPATTWALPVGRPTLPWDYFPLARHPGAIRTLCSRKEENTLPRDDFCAESKGGTLVTPLKGLRREHGVHAPAEAILDFTVVSFEETPCSRFMRQSTAALSLSRKLSPGTRRAGPLTLPAGPVTCCCRRSRTSWTWPPRRDAVGQRAGRGGGRTPGRGRRG